MNNHSQRAIAFIATFAILLCSHRPAHAQGGPGIWYSIAERLDQRKLERDQARLQYDISRGNTDRVNRDLERLRLDQWWLTVDRTGGRPNVAAPSSTTSTAALIPHPQYPGYGYYPSNPSQLYQLPQAGTSATQTAAPAQTFAVILNSEASDSPVKYVVDGVVYTTESGRRQQLAVDRGSEIAYDRGGDFGVQKYALPAGVYEFRSSETGWALVKLNALPKEHASEHPAAPAARGSGVPTGAAMGSK